MPCHDGREEQDRKDRARRYDALTALLCGVLQGKEDAILLGQSWRLWHDVVDEHREFVKYDFEDPRILEALNNCDKILDEAYNQLCT